MYDSFVEGAKEGFTTAVRIIPYLVAFLVGIAVFRTSGAMDILVGGIGAIVEMKVLSRIGMKMSVGWAAPI